jgi:hypothetical protein
MRRYLYLLLLIASTLFVLPAFGANKNWETAKVISQELDAVSGSAVAMPRGTMHAAFPAMRRSNIVVVETADNRMTWSELGKKAIVLAAGSSIQFYREDDRFVVLDASGKKHKFALVGMSTIPRQTEARPSTDSLSEETDRPYLSGQPRP